MADLDLCYTPVTELVRLIRKREVSPVEVVRNALARAEEVERLAAQFEERAAGRSRVIQADLATQSAVVGERLDALAYPTWANAPRLIGDLNTPDGNNSWQLSPPTGFPAVTVPMGYVRDGLPVGLQLLGDAWSEGRLIGLAYAYEQATRHRRPPEFRPTVTPFDPR